MEDIEKERKITVEVPADLFGEDYEVLLSGSHAEKTHQATHFTVRTDHKQKRAYRYSDKDLLVTKKSLTISSSQSHLLELQSNPCFVQIRKGHRHFEPFLQNESGYVSTTKCKQQFLSFLDANFDKEKFLMECIKAQDYHYHYHVASNLFLDLFEKLLYRDLSTKRFQIIHYRGAAVRVRFRSIYDKFAFYFWGEKYDLICRTIADVEQALIELLRESAKRESKNERLPQQNLYTVKLEQATMEGLDMWSDAFPGEETMCKTRGDPLQNPETTTAEKKKTRQYVDETLWTKICVEGKYKFMDKIYDSMTFSNSTQACNRNNYRKPTRESLLEEFAETDLVFAVRCNFWPMNARAWSQRQTRSGLPSSATKSRIKQQGCDLVPKSFPGGNEELDWRISFSRAEELMFQAITSKQRKTYIIFKGLLKNAPEVEEGKEKLSTYHAKTVFLWSIERNTQEVWTSSNLPKLVEILLRELLQALTSKILPHYFISSFNLLEAFSPELILKAITTVCMLLAEPLFVKNRKLQMTLQLPPETTKSCSTYINYMHRQFPFSLYYQKLLHHNPGTPFDQTRFFQLFLNNVWNPLRKTNHGRNWAEKMTQKLPKGLKKDTQTCFLDVFLKFQSHDAFQKLLTAQKVETVWLPQSQKVVAILLGEHLHQAILTRNILATNLSEQDCISLYTTFFRYFKLFLLTDETDEEFWKESTSQMNLLKICTFELNSTSDLANLADVYLSTFDPKVICDITKFVANLTKFQSFKLKERQNEWQRNVTQNGSSHFEQEKQMPATADLLNLNQFHVKKKTKQEANRDMYSNLGKQLAMFITRVTPMVETRKRPQTYGQLGKMLAKFATDTSCTKQTVFSKLCFKCPFNEPSSRCGTTETATDTHIQLMNMAFLLAVLQDEMKRDRWSLVSIAAHFAFRDLRQEFEHVTLNRMEKRVVHSDEIQQLDEGNPPLPTANQPHVEPKKSAGSQQPAETNRLLNFFKFIGEIEKDQEFKPLTLIGSLLQKYHQ